MIYTVDAIKSFKTQLQQSVVVCSERCLVYSAKWSAELLHGIKPTYLDDRVQFTNNDMHLPTISPYQNHYDSKLNPLTEEEYNAYLFAKALFEVRQYDRASEVLEGYTVPKLYFLRLYSKYMAGEKRKEELTQDVLGATEDTKSENKELDSIYDELSEDYANEKLDAFSKYLYGVVLIRRKVGFKAAAVLLESIKEYQFNWSAWMELATLVQNSKMFNDLQNIVNRDLGNSVMKDFFLAKLCVELDLSVATFKAIMEPLTAFFPNCAYITSQWAVLYYNQMQYNEASTLFEDLRKRYPSRIEDLDIFSNILYLLESKDRLCILALECDKIDKYRPETCCVRANYCCILGDIPESVTYFKRALKLNRHYNLAWTLLGHDYIELKNTGAAIECYRRAVDSNSRDFRAWYGLGQAYEVLKYPYEALYYYQTATNLKPNDSRMWKALAGCYQSLQQETEMNDCLRRAKSCDRKRKKIEMIQVGNVYLSQGREDKAYQCYHNVWEQGLKDVKGMFDEIAEISLVLARYALDRRQYAEAEQYANTALNARHPYHEQARVLLDKIKNSR